ncbi:MAG: hypothetical protein ACRD3W_25475, partial [Terriglobales bacterium]
CSALWNNFCLNATVDEGNWDVITQALIPLAYLRCRSCRYQDFCLRCLSFVPDHLRNSSGLAARNAGTVSGVSQAAMILSHRAVTAFCIPFIRKLTPSGEMLTITSPSTP